ncbi:hypothetical protein [Nannocystis punicea]|uniref:Uncharacterized protein n=1 Tax=Nannocystis punicea TaxID=2995304 RepID=A0ABY7GU91_9BACT|nr:hypothetical protein [Nannocystis poenicansa]WAS90488.1 hypothetical protein O0S08_30235 [Nannocystis poenicansa]
MSRYAYSPRILTIVLALAACELPTKLGNLSATDGDNAETTGDWTATDGETTGATTAATTGATTEEPADTWWTSTSMFDPSETTSAQTTEQETSTTGMAIPLDCLELGEADCAANGCMAYYGSAYEFPGCAQGLLFLGCSDPKECDHAEQTFCREGTEEAYKLETTCAPPGYVECEPPGVAFCDDCRSLDEAECLAEPVECQPLYGAPHIVVDDQVCADYGDQEFMACQANGGACPPFIPVVCHPDMPEKVYDSPSGCIPSGWQECGEMGTPECS